MSGALHQSWRDEGDSAGIPVVFAHALGLDLHVWDAVLPLLPPGLRLIRYDLRGHGDTEVPPGPYSMGGLVRDAEQLLDELAVKGAVLVGLSLGGMVAQGLAVKRPDLVRALVLSNTAAKIGTAEGWRTRTAAVRQGGTAAVAGTVIDRWFSRRSRQDGLASACEKRLLATSAEGYAGCCAALAGADFITPTSGLQLPALVIAGTEDRATPPDLVRELADLIYHARFRLIRGAGHLPPIDRPAEFAAELVDFLRHVGAV